MMSMVMGMPAATLLGCMVIVITAMVMALLTPMIMMVVMVMDISAFRTYLTVGKAVLPPKKQDFFKASSICSLEI